MTRAQSIVEAVSHAHAQFPGKVKMRERDLDDGDVKVILAQELVAWAAEATCQDVKNMAQHVA